MVSADRSEPPDVVDGLLWRDAQQILARHSGADATGACVWCAVAWPCSPRRLAERADAASRRSWNAAWTARLDLYGLRALPAWRAELDGRTAGEPRRPMNNGGLFR